MKMRLFLIMIFLMPLIVLSQAYRPAETITLTAGGGTQNVSSSNYNENIFITGSATLVANWTIQPSGAFLYGHTVKFVYDADITLGGNSITIFGQTVSDYMADKDFTIKCFYDGASWSTVFMDMSENYVSTKNDSIFIGEDTVYQLAGSTFWQRNTNTVSPALVTDSVAIGATTSNHEFDLIGNMYMPFTTNAVQKGIIYKGANRFFHNYSTAGVGHNIFIGELSGNLTTTGASNIGIGYNTLNSNGAGQNNTAVGYLTLQSNTAGQNNTSIGSLCLISSTVGMANTGVGMTSLTANTTGSQNTGIGYEALRSVTTGSDNTAVGYQAGELVTGDRNVLVGYDAGNTIVGADNCIMIGYNAQPQKDASTNAQLNIGGKLFTDANLNVTVNSGTDTVHILDQVTTPHLHVDSIFHVSKYDTIASVAGTIAIGPYNNIVITGNNDIDSITTVSKIPEGALIYIEWVEPAGATVISNGKNLKLAGDFAPTNPYSTMILQRRGDFFIEFSRSAN
jgi:hypothetical protein